MAAFHGPFFRLYDAGPVESASEAAFQDFGFRGRSADANPENGAKWRLLGLQVGPSRDGAFRCLLNAVYMGAKPRWRATPMPDSSCCDAVAVGREAICAGQNPCCATSSGHMIHV